MQLWGVFINMETNKWNWNLLQQSLVYISNYSPYTVGYTCSATKLLMHFQQVCMNITFLSLNYDGNSKIQCNWQKQITIKVCCQTISYQ